MFSFKEKGISIFEKAGIEVNGKNPWDIQVHNDNFYERTFRGGSLAFGEAYMDDWWSVKRLDQFFTIIFSNQLENQIKSIAMLPYYFKSFLFNPQKGENALKVGRQHYDIGNDLYSRMLDKRLVYTCGYWDSFQDLDAAKNLDEAQEHKLDMICRKIGLKEGDEVLDIGCGWGSFMHYAAEKYGARCVGISISKEQIKYGNETKGDLPIEFRLQDYRELDEKFDHIVSIGMFEHVGYKNYKNFMSIVSKNLKEDGLFLLHTIGSNVSVKYTDPWIDKYIFPNSMLPSATQIAKAAENIFVIEDWHNFGPQYDYTLMQWYENFKRAWPEISNKYDLRFYKMWEYYLLSSAATFRSRINQVWQILFSKHGRKVEYKR
ncbi:MAG: cyclopropane fatty acyl phospholipid synthase [Sulfurospirillaceae bacterium]|nr:cyclopropane fatty acyl phospholipid synthase [Sulfurospirillaceae bacterium]